MGLNQRFGAGGRQAGAAGAMADASVSVQPPADDVTLAELEPDDDGAAVGGAGELLLRLKGFAAAWACCSARRIL